MLQVSSWLSCSATCRRLEGGEEDLLQFTRTAMYSFPEKKLWEDELLPAEEEVVHKFLAALKGLAGKRSEWHMMFLLRCVLTSVTAVVLARTWDTQTVQQSAVLPSLLD